MTSPALRHDYAAALPEIVRPWSPTLPPRPEGGRGPELVAVNDALAADLEIDPAWVRGAEALVVLGGRGILPGSRPVAQAYAGHQFGGFSPVLGDGRAVLLGEIATPGGLRDIALKGSGRTTFSRGGDGRAVLGPVLREYLFGESMAALGVPTTRALAAVTTGDRVYRDGRMPPGAVLTRVAASHLRVGTFELVARSLPQDARAAVLPRLVAYAAARHHPSADPGPGQGLALLDAVVTAQADLLAHWMSLGFVHGVMNTDNTTISGETIDYGPCAWVEAYDEDAVFSSIDTGGRYRFGHQPAVALWNLSRLAESLLPLVAEDPNIAVSQATSILDQFGPRYHQAWQDRLRAKLGLPDTRDEDAALVDDLLAGLADARADYTSTWRLLAAHLRGQGAPGVPGVSEGWLARWRARVPGDPRERAAAMDAVNPAYVPRNHLVDAALVAAEEGDLAPFERLLAALTDPYADHPHRADLATPAPPGFTERFVTFCGT
jgi:uncharacterized protein YdiU (UPF0061 family)